MGTDKIMRPDLTDLLSPDDEEVHFRICQKEQLAPDIIREIAHFLECVADYYDRHREEKNHVSS